MYRFEIAESSVNYRLLSSSYSKSKIYCLLFICFLIVCLVVYLLVLFLSNLSVSPDEATTSTFIEHQNSANVSQKYIYKTADSGGNVIATENPVPTVFKPVLFEDDERNTTIKGKAGSTTEHSFFRSGNVNNQAETSSNLTTSLPPENLTTAQINASSRPVLHVGEATEIPSQPSHLSTEPGNLSTVKPTTTKAPGHIEKSCGRRIIKETVTDVSKVINTYFGEFPWMLVLLYSNETNYDMFKCGASLIAPGVALTAAHCVAEKRVKYKIRAGDWYLNGRIKNEFLPHKDRDVVEIERHQKFEPLSLGNNIALLRLSPKLSYDDHIRPICLPDWDIETDINHCLETGWGKDREDSTSHHAYLRKVGLSCLTLEDCQERLQNTVLGQYYHLNNGDMCAMNASSSIITCKGDGGGPLICPSKKDKDVYYQVGISTWSVNCSPDVPSLYTNVEYFRDWIDDIVEKFKNRQMGIMKEEYERSG